MELRFGRDVETQDGQRVGPVESVLLSCDDREVSHVIVESRGERYLVPLNMVQGNVEDRLVLHAHINQFEQLPHAHVSGPTTGEASVARAGGEEFVTPSVAERGQRLREAIGVEADTVELSASTQLEMQGSVVGQLAGVDAELYANRLQYLLVRLATSGQLVRLGFDGLQDLRADLLRFGIGLDEGLRLVNQRSGGYVSEQPHQSDIQRRGDGGP